MAGIINPLVAHSRRYGGTTTSGGPGGGVGGGVVAPPPIPPSTARLLVQPSPLMAPSRRAFDAAASSVTP